MIGCELRTGFVYNVRDYAVPWMSLLPTFLCRLRLKCDGTSAETRSGLSPKRTSLFKSAGASFQSTTGSRGVQVSGIHAGYTVFRGSVRVMATQSIRQFPFTSPPVRHRVPSGFNWTLRTVQWGVHFQLLPLSNCTWPTDTATVVGVYGTPFLERAFSAAVAFCWTLSMSWKPHPFKEDVNFRKSPKSSVPKYGD